jgi:hypothetical protein
MSYKKENFDHNFLAGEWEFSVYVEYAYSFYDLYFVSVEEVFPTMKVKSLV